MPTAVREMARTVHPELAGAALAALLRHGSGPLGPAGRTVRRLLAAGAPVPEGVHRELLGALYGCGREAVSDAGRLLFERPRDPLLRALMTGGDMAALIARARPVELWLHVGHRTRTVLRPGELTVSHRRYLGGDPVSAESVFVCAVHTAAVAAVTGRPVEVALLAADGAVLAPDAPWRPGPAPAVRGWRLRWDERAGPPGPARPSTAGASATGLPGAARELIAGEPAADWRLSAVAAALGVAPRTLQRSFTRAGTTFQAELAAVRLDVAGHLVRRTRLPLAEIAAAAGFTDHPHLTRRFRAHHGCGPAEFRRRGAGGTE
ncbi:helix-turn-helix transcriptional regulator [Kitasatospora sp. NPDC058201]|uniref:helix-turn-helix transcriptional regulator n=1 Tax=unclassified Kitasatospora TaxID=2633591 RepID=UPI00365A0680